jgi:ATP-binding cassette subfamily F protein 3
LGQVENTLADTELYQESRKNELQTALVEQARLRESVEQLEQSWLTLSEQLEQADILT